MGRGADAQRRAPPEVLHGPGRARHAVLVAGAQEGAGERLCDPAGAGVAVGNGGCAASSLAVSVHGSAAVAVNSSPASACSNVRVSAPAGGAQAAALSTTRRSGGPPPNTQDRSQRAAAGATARYCSAVAHGRASFLSARGDGTCLLRDSLWVSVLTLKTGTASNSTAESSQAIHPSPPTAFCVGGQTGPAAHTATRTRWQLHGSIL